MRFFLFLILALAASGCATTHSIYLSEPGDLDLLDARMRGHQATIYLEDGTRNDGRVLFVRADSTAWEQVPERRAVPTAEVVRMTRVGDYNKILRDAGAGAGVGVGLAAAVMAAISGTDLSVGRDEAFELTFTLIGQGAFYGGIVGAINGRQRAYILRP